MPRQERRARREQRRQNRRSGGIISSLFQSQQGPQGQQNSFSQPQRQQQQDSFSRQETGNDLFGDQQRGQGDFSQQNNGGYGQQQRQQQDTFRQNPNSISGSQAQGGYQSNSFFSPRGQQGQQQQGPLGLLIGLFAPKTQQQTRSNRESSNEDRGFGNQENRSLAGDRGFQVEDQRMDPSFQEQRWRDPLDRRFENYDGRGIGDDGDRSFADERRVGGGRAFAGERRFGNGNGADDERYAEGGRERSYWGQGGGRFDAERGMIGQRRVEDWRREGEYQGRSVIDEPPLYEENIGARNFGKR